MAFYPLFTKEAIKEAREKMHPRHTKSMWVKGDNVNETPYPLDLDTAITIYTATKV